MVIRNSNYLTNSNSTLTLDIDGALIQFDVENIEITDNVRTRQTFSTNPNVRASIVSQVRTDQEGDSMQVTCLDLTLDQINLLNNAFVNRLPVSGVISSKNGSVSRGISEGVISQRPIQSVINEAGDNGIMFMITGVLEFITSKEV